MTTTLSHLCSAHFGKRRLSLPVFLRSSRRKQEKIKKKRDDEIYGFITPQPQAQWSPRQQSLAERRCTSQRDTYAQTSECSTWRSTTDLSVANSLVDNSFEAASTCEADQPPQPKYPKTYAEVEDMLEKGNSLAPANIPMLVTRDYSPPKHWTSQDEVKVRRGQLVNAMYKTCDWVMVRTPEERSGFVPFSYVEAVGVKKPTSDFCQQYPDGSDVLIDSAIESLENFSMEIAVSETSQRLSSDSLPSQKSMGSQRNIKSSQDQHVPKYEQIPSAHTSPMMHCSTTSFSPCHSSPNDSAFNTSSSFSHHSSLNDSSFHKSFFNDSSFFLKHMGTRLTVLFDYDGDDENDVTVEHNDVVTLLNDEDPDWLWVRRDDGTEGFMPKAYAVDLTQLNLDPTCKTTYL